MSSALAENTCAFYEDNECNELDKTATCASCSFDSVTLCNGYTVVKCQIRPQSDDALIIAQNIPWISM